MKNGKYHFHRVLSCFLVDAYRNSAAVVLDRNGIIGVDGYFDMGTETGQSLVHRIVHDLVDQVVETSGGCGAYIHAGTFSDSLQSFQYLDVVGRIVSYLCSIPDIVIRVLSAVFREFFHDFFLLGSIVIKDGIHVLDISVVDFCHSLLLWLFKHVAVGLRDPACFDPVKTVYGESVIDKFIQSRTGNKCLNTAYGIQKIILSAGIQFRQYVVQHQDRLFTDQPGDQLYFRQLQRQCAGPLLSLRSESSEIDVMVYKGKIIPVGTRSRGFEIAVPVPGSFQSVRKLFFRNIGLIGDHQTLPAAGKLFMDISHDLVERAYELCSSFDDF